MEQDRKNENIIPKESLGNSGIEEEASIEELAKKTSQEINKGAETALENNERLKDRFDNPEINAILDDTDENINNELSKVDDEIDEVVEEPENEAGGDDPTQEQDKKEISDEVLSQLSEVMQTKKDLELKIDALKESPESKKFDKLSQDLEKKRKKLEGFKKISDSSSVNGGGFFASYGNINVNNIGNNINIEGNIISPTFISKDKDRARETVGDSQEDMSLSEEAGRENKEVVDLQKEAENLIEKTKIEILKLQQEELEYSTESLNVKIDELMIESKKIEVEIDIWSSGDMTQEIFDKTLHDIDGSKEVKNKESFLKFREINNELRNYQESHQSNEYNKNVAKKQEEIAEIERNIKKLSSPNEGMILTILNEYEERKSDNSKTEENLEQQKHKIN